LEDIYNIINENILKGRRIKNSLFISKNLMKKNSLKPTEKIIIKVEDVQDQKHKKKDKDKDKDKDKKDKKKSILKSKPNNKEEEDRDKFKLEKDKSIKRISKIVKEYNLDPWQEK